LTRGCFFQRTISGEQFGDSEVEQLRLAVFIDQNIARLEIAMHNSPAMRRFDPGTDLQEEFKTLPNR
jgi:hypothetical protein